MNKAEKILEEAFEKFLNATKANAKAIVREVTLKLLDEPAPSNKKKVRRKK
jgi:hypothetical protein